MKGASNKIGLLVNEYETIINTIMIDDVCEMLWIVWMWSLFWNSLMNVKYCYENMKYKTWLQLMKWEMNEMWIVIYKKHKNNKSSITNYHNTIVICYLDEI